MRNKSFMEGFYIRDDGRVNIPHLEIDIVLGCNLRCSHCAHLSPYRKGFVSTEKIVHWFETWNKKIHSERINLLGGEPFLHPDLATVVLESRRTWNDSILEIVTNGLLIPQVSQDVFDALKKANFKVIISDHSGVDLSRENIVAGCDRLKESEIPYELRQSNDTWLVQHQWNENGIPTPFQSSPSEAWSNCISKHCPSLANNQLYKCAVLASVIEGINEGALSSSIWKDVQTYTPLPPGADATLILKHFRTTSIKECCICPDKVIVTEAKQIPHLPQTGRKSL